MKRLVLVLVGVLFMAGSANALTLAGLRYRTALKLGYDTSSTATRWTSAELNTWINDGVRYVAKAALCYERDTTYAMVAQKTKYTMPSDFIRVKGVKVGSKGASLDLDRSPTGMKSSSIADLGKATGTRLLPTQWEDAGEKTRILTISPAPGINDSMTVTYFAYPWMLDYDTSTCALPLGYQFCVPDYAASMAWDRTRSSAPYWSNFIDRLQWLVPTEQKQTEPENPRVTPQPNP